MGIARYRTALTIGATIVGMLVVGWPVLTAISALFWSVYVADADSDADMAADRIIVRMPGILKYRIMEDRPVILQQGSRYCSVEFGHFSQTDGKRRSAVMNLESAIHGFRNGADGLNGYLVELEALKSLPPPLLGALDGCIRGSLLARYCEDRARAILQKAFDKNRIDLQHKLSKNAGDAADMLCLAVDGVKSKLSDRRPR